MLSLMANAEHLSSSASSTTLHPIHLWTAAHGLQHEPRMETSVSVGPSPCLDVLMRNDFLDTLNDISNEQKMAVDLSRRPSRDQELNSATEDKPLDLKVRLETPSTSSTLSSSSSLSSSATSTTPLLECLRSSTSARGSRQYPCLTCGKVFTSASNRNMHQRIHKGVRPFRCVPCGVHFRQKAHLQKHQRTQGHIQAVGVTKAVEHDMSKKDDNDDHDGTKEEKAMAAATTTSTTSSTSTSSTTSTSSVSAAADSTGEALPPRRRSCVKRKQARPSRFSSSSTLTSLPSSEQSVVSLVEYNDVSHGYECRRCSFSSHELSVLKEHVREAHPQHLSGPLVPSKRAKVDNLAENIRCKKERVKAVSSSKKRSSEDESRMCSKAPILLDLSHTRPTEVSATDSDENHVSTTSNARQSTSTPSRSTANLFDLSVKSLYSTSTPLSASTPLATSTPTAASTPLATSTPLSTSTNSLLRASQLSSKEKLSGMSALSLLSNLLVTNSASSSVFSPTVNMSAAALLALAVADNSSTSNSPVAKSHNSLHSLPHELIGNELGAKDNLDSRSSAVRDASDLRHPCGICGKTFSSKSNLTAHKKIHSGERPFECGVCLKRFRQKAHLQKHETTHSGRNVVQANHVFRVENNSDGLNGSEEMDEGVELTASRRTSTSLATDTSNDSSAYSSLNASS